MADLIEFLRQRKVHEETLKTLTDNKIDREVLLKMEDQELEKYLPAHGDRISAYAFCKTFEDPKSNTETPGTSSEQAQQLLDRVRSKMPQGRKRSCSDTVTNRAAPKKPTRRVELGWMDWDNERGEYKQVRIKGGGGIRHLAVPRNAEREDFLNSGKELFFADGVPKKGPLVDFHVSVKDFNLRDIDNLTVAELYEKTKVKLLRLYICTEKIRPIQIDDSGENTESESDSLPDILSSDRTDQVASGRTDVLCPESATSNEDDSHTEPEEAATGTPTVIFNRQAPRRRRLQLRPTPKPQTTESDRVGDDGQAERTSPSTSSQAHSVEQNLTLPPSEASEQKVAVIDEASGGVDDTDPVRGSSTSASISSQVHSDEEQSSDLTPALDEQSLTEIDEAFRSLHESLEGVQTLSIRRQLIMEDTFQVYSDPCVAFKGVHVEFSGERGSDDGGLTKDLYTNVWQNMLRDYFIGEDAMVPFLPLHRQRSDREKFVTIGRILSHTTALLKFVPTRISRCTLLSIVFGEDCVDETLLLEDFMLHVGVEDRAVLKKAMKNFTTLSPKEMDTLINFCSIHDLTEMPTPTKIRSQILSMAQNILLDRPAPLVVKLKKGIPEVHRDIFWSLLTVSAVNFLFEKQRPTPSKLLEVLVTEEEVLRPEEERSLYYFRRYLQQMDQDELSLFLQFCTGATIMPSLLTVSFNHTTGEGRCPVAHTCSNHLELPATYHSLSELKREFSSVLGCFHSFEMSIL